MLVMPSNALIATVSLTQFMPGMTVHCASQLAQVTPTAFSIACGWLVVACTIHTRFHPRNCTCQNNNNRILNQEQITYWMNVVCWSFIIVMMH